MSLFDFYEKMRGGKIKVGMEDKGKGKMRGKIDERKF